MFKPNDYKPDGNMGSIYLDKAGTYCVAYTKFEERGASQSAGTPYVKMYAEVVASDDDPSQVGKRFSEKIYLSEACYPRLGSLCAAMGYHDPFELTDDDSVKRAWVGRPFKIKIKVEEYNGKMYPKTGFVEMNHSDSEKKAMEMWVADRAANGDGQTYSNGEPAQAVLGDPGFGDSEIPY